MTNENDEILMSQLADGELTSDETNDLLLGVLDDPAGREKLKDLLRLRQSTAAWRRTQPAGPVMVVTERKPARPRHSLAAWRMGSLAVAACVGGLLVLCGVWVAGLTGRTAPGGGGSSGASGTQAVARVTAEQRRQVASVFALHESVAGPLAWYASDDQNVRLSAAQPAEAGQIPIGVLLKLQSPAGGAPRTLVIVCRNDQPAVIQLPAESPGRVGMRVYLAPRAVNGKVDVQYAIAMDGHGSQAPVASLTGKRTLGLSEAPLGQLAMGDKLVNVEAAAWPMHKDAEK